MNEATTFSCSWSGIASIGLVFTNIVFLIVLSYRCAYSSAERRQSKSPKERKDTNSMRSLFATTKKNRSTTSTLHSYDSLHGIEENDTIYDDDDGDDTIKNNARKKVIAGGYGYGGATVPAPAPKQRQEEMINESIIRFITFLYSSRPVPQVNNSTTKLVATSTTSTEELEWVEEKTIEHVKSFSLLLIKLVMKHRSEKSDFFESKPEKTVLDVDVGCDKKYEYALKLKYEPPYLALAAILTAFESLSREKLPQIYRQHLVDEVFRIHKIDCTTPEVYEIRVNLRSLFHEMQKQQPKREVAMNEYQQQRMI